MGKLTDQNISILKERMIDTLKVSDINFINKQLRSIKDSLIITGVGGSVVVCEFARKVLEENNNCLIKILDPRDLFYSSISGYKNILSISYSGNNFGVNLSFQNNLNQYLLTNNSKKRKNVNSIVYSNNIKKEKSFISIAATLIPITILLNYYLEDNIIKFINNTFGSLKSLDLPNHKNITIIYGNESSSAAKFLESTFIEAGIANVMLCTKYNYCHGQTTLPYHFKKNDMILFKSSDSELDRVIIKEAQNLYDTVTIIESDNEDVILSDFEFLIQSVYLVYGMSKKYKKDLSIVKYAPAVKSLYHFEGSV